MNDLLSSFSHGAKVSSTRVDNTPSYQQATSQKVEEADLVREPILSYVLDDSFIYFVYFGVARDRLTILQVTNQPLLRKLRKPT